MFIIKLLSQHVSGIIIHHQENKTVYYCIWCSAYDPAPHNHSQHNQCRTPHVVIHGLVHLMMGIMMPETCWDRSLIINIRLVACCLFISLHPTFHDAQSQEPKTPKMSIIFQSVAACSNFWISVHSIFGKRESLLYKKIIPVTDLEWPGGFQEVKVPSFHDNDTGWW